MSSPDGARVTIGDVAEHAGVSPTTVSHVLSGRRPVSAATKERVQAVIDELGFRPSRLAAGLRLGRSHTIALLVPAITNPFYPELARGVGDVLTGVGYQTFIGNTDSHPEQERELLQSAIERQVDGVIFAGFSSGRKQIQEAMRSGVAAVLIGEGNAPARVDTVHSDDRRAGYDATEHLLRLGHREIAFLAAPPGVPPSDARRQGYLDALAEAGVKRPLVFHAEFSRAGGAEALAEALAEAAPTAVFCANDMMAIGALDVARQRQIEVPGRLSVVGFDDVEAAALVSPALTTVHNPPYEHGRVAAELLLERIEGDYEGRARDRTIPHRLVERASSAAPGEA